MLTIEKNVPMPTVRQEYNLLPFDQLEPGDSFFVPDFDGKLAHRLQSQISSRKRADNRRYTTRCEANGIRVWRRS